MYREFFKEEKEEDDVNDEEYSEIPLLRPPKIMTFYLLKTLF